jgi:hypothetical protein
MVVKAADSLGLPTADQAAGGEISASITQSCDGGIRILLPAE